MVPKSKHQMRNTDSHAARCTRSVCSTPYKTKGASLSQGVSHLHTPSHQVSQPSGGTHHTWACLQSHHDQAAHIIHGHVCNCIFLNMLRHHWPRRAAESKYPRATRRVFPIRLLLGVSMCEMIESTNIFIYIYIDILIYAYYYYARVHHALTLSYSVQANYPALASWSMGSHL